MLRLKITDTDIDKKEILRYLGHKNQEVDSLTNSTIDTCVEECLHIAKPCYIYRVFSAPLSEILPLSGESIKKHLQGAKSMVVMAATLGIQIDSAISLCERQDLTKALILNACATEMIEKVCNKAQSEIVSELNPNKHTNHRFSPGYGDLPLSIQPDILKMLDTQRKIGLINTEHFVLIPRKSVTAIFGVFEQDQGTNIQQCPNCTLCNLVNCSFRKLENLN